MLAFIMVSTRRVKAMGALACLVLIFLVVFRNRKKKLSRKVKIFAVVVVAVAGVAALYQTISYYFLMGNRVCPGCADDRSPVYLRRTIFPFGNRVGDIRVRIFLLNLYSPVYGMYWMAGIWGISQSYSSFVSDTFWADGHGTVRILSVFASPAGRTLDFYKEGFLHSGDYRCDFCVHAVLDLISAHIKYKRVSICQSGGSADGILDWILFWRVTERMEKRSGYLLQNGGRKRIRSRRQRRMRRRENKIC